MKFYPHHLVQVLYNLQVLYRQPKLNHSHLKSIVFFIDSKLFKNLFILHTLKLILSFSKSFKNQYVLSKSKSNGNMQINISSTLCSISQILWILRKEFQLNLCIDQVFENLINSRLKPGKQNSFDRHHLLTLFGNLCNTSAQGYSTKN